MENNLNLWKQVLKTTVGTIKILAMSHLPLRKHCESVNHVIYSHNRKFINIICSLEKYDIILEDHLKT